MTELNLAARRGALLKYQQLGEFGGSGSGAATGIYLTQIRESHPFKPSTVLEGGYLPNQPGHLQSDRCHIKITLTSKARWLWPSVQSGIHSKSEVNLSYIIRHSQKTKTKQTKTKQMD